MIRALLTTVLIAVAVAAAPTPRSDPPAFGADGLLTAEDLKAVAFKSRITASAEELKQLKHRPDDYDVAVHLPRTRFKRGEPIPAYFVVKNNLGKALDIDGRLNFTGRDVQCVNSAKLAIRRRDGKPVEAASLHLFHCGSPRPLVQIPEHGFSVMRGDLSRLGEQPLPEGEYEVEWSCQMRVSAPVAFTVLPWSAPSERPKPPSDQLRFLAIEPDDAEAGDEDGFLWKDFSLESIDARRMSAALSCGPFGTYVPDVRTIPSTDGRLVVSATLRGHEREHTLLISLKSADPRREVAFDEPPHVYLQVEEEKPAGKGTKSERSLRDELKRGEALPIKTPLVIEIPFDLEHWTEANFGSGRLAVIVTSGKLELPSRGDRMERAKQLESLERPQIEQPWKGILRSGFIPLNRKPPRE